MEHVIFLLVVVIIFYCSEKNVFRKLVQKGGAGDDMAMIVGLLSIIASGVGAYFFFYKKCDEHCPVNSEVISSKKDERCMGDKCIKECCACEPTYKFDSPGMKCEKKDHFIVKGFPRWLQQYNGTYYKTTETCKGDKAIPKKSIYRQHNGYGYLYHIGGRRPAWWINNTKCSVHSPTIALSQGDCINSPDGTPCKGKWRTNTKTKVPDVKPLLGFYNTVLPKMTVTHGQ